MKNSSKRPILNIIAAAIIIIASVSHTQAAFKDLGWSVRAAGMGGAYTALSDDSTGMHYNPAGLVQVVSPEMNMMYSKLFAGLDSVQLGLGSGSFVYPTERAGTFAFSWSNFSSVNQYAEDMFTLSYAQNLNVFVRHYLRMRLVPEISFGFNLKYLRHTYKLDNRTENDPVFEAGDSADALALDLGLWVKPLPDRIRGLSAGLSMKNINQPDVGLKTTDKVPMETRFGLAYKMDRLYRLQDITTSLDLEYRNQDWGKNSDKFNMHIGIEASAFNKLMAFRLGGNFNEIASGLRFNVPEKFNLQLNLDYAFLWPLRIEESLGTHRVSLTYRF